VAELAVGTKVTRAKLEVTAQRSLLSNVRTQIHTRMRKDPTGRALYRYITSRLGLLERVTATNTQIEDRAPGRTATSTLGKPTIFLEFAIFALLDSEPPSVISLGLSSVANDGNPGLGNTASSLDFLLLLLDNLVDFWFRNVCIWFQNWNSYLHSSASTKSLSSLGNTAAELAALTDNFGIGNNNTTLTLAGGSITRPSAKLRSLLSVRSTGELTVLGLFFALNSFNATQAGFRWQSSAHTSLPSQLLSVGNSLRLKVGLIGLFGQAGRILTSIPPDTIYIDNRIRDREKWGLVSHKLGGVITIVLCLIGTDIGRPFKWLLLLFGQLAFVAAVIVNSLEVECRVEFIIIVNHHHTNFF
jgi:hypothetical protein